MDVNQFRWKTIWTAILGHSVRVFPVLFRHPHLSLQINWNIFLTPAAARRQRFCILPRQTV
ncbi:DUF2684 family protein [Pantoea sp. SGAir0430]|nr:DUF2684 family protein [Pantoea dispersa]RVU76643.1 DUF2684 family protein [Pantoea dispersa]THD31580.1 DUF2684 family protein [Pantoea sp. R102]